MITPNIRPENTAMRNFLRNITGYIIGKTLPGNQRITTTRDARAMIDSVDMYSCVNYDVITVDSNIAGVSSVGE
jgi:hypothetical protein